MGAHEEQKKQQNVAQGAKVADHNHKQTGKGNKVMECLTVDIIAKDNGPFGDYNSIHAYGAGKSDSDIQNFEEGEIKVKVREVERQFYWKVEGHDCKEKKKNKAPGFEESVRGAKEGDRRISLGDGSSWKRVALIFVKEAEKAMNPPVEFEFIAKELYKFPARFFQPQSSFLALL